MAQRVKKRFTCGRTLRGKNNSNIPAIAQHNKLKTSDTHDKSLGMQLAAARWRCIK